MHHNGSVIQENPLSLADSFQMPRRKPVLFKLLLDILGDGTHVPIRISVGNEEVTRQCGESREIKKDGIDRLFITSGPLDKLGNSFGLQRKLAKPPKRKSRLWNPRSFHRLLAQDPAKIGAAGRALSLHRSAPVLESFFTGFGDLYLLSAFDAIGFHVSPFPVGSPLRGSNYNTSLFSVKSGLRLYLLAFLVIGPLLFKLKKENLDRNPF